MCLWFACFGLHKHDDDCYAPPHRAMPLPPPGAGTKPLQPAQGNGHAAHAHYGNGVHHQTAAAGARKGPAAAIAVARDDAPLAYAGTVRQQPAWNGRVAEAAAHGHGAQQQHYYNYYERQPVHREDAMDHRYYYTGPTADHERY